MVGKNTAKVQRETKSKDGEREMLFPYNCLIPDSKLALMPGNYEIASFRSINYSILLKLALMRL